MINALRFRREEGKDPYSNLAIERYLMQTCPEGQCILYLWQNARTVVIGRNQNAWKECRITQLEEDGGHLARRLSGGGAVFHDDGNLNFTFITRHEDQNVPKQLEVIVEACRSFGISAEKSGRNDVLADGRKFSGNAFFDSRGRAYHHGTLLINADTALMTRYLAPSKAKLEAKGVDSVRSRVANLHDLCPSVTVDSMSEAMIKAFEKIYGYNVLPLDSDLWDRDIIDTYRNEFSSWEWLYGRDTSFSAVYEKRFGWGEARMCIGSDRGKVTSFVLYSDSMDWSLAERAEKLAVGCPVKDLSAVFEKQGREDPAFSDLSELLKK